MRSVFRRGIAAGFVIIVATSWAFAASAQTLLPGFNGAFYTNAFTAAKSVAMPFLLRQGYATIAGVTVTDSTLHHAGNAYVVHQTYQNGGMGYTVPASQYGAYGLSGVSAVWPYGLPDILFNPGTSSWDCIGDCVSYVMRVLAATGDTSTTGNAYLNLISTIKGANTTIFASKGYSATAYQLGAAFPTLGAGNINGWQYIAGNVVADSIDATNHAIRPTVGNYNGVAKGGFAAAQAGDVLAWSYPRTASYNGHLMILESTPQLLGFDSLKAYMPSQSTANINALMARFKVYAAPLFDCSGKKAHFRDSRQTVSGIGHGTVLVLTSHSGDVPQGFIFGAGNASGSRIDYDSIGVNVFAISVGRWKNSHATSMASWPATAPALHVFPNPVATMLYVTGNADGHICISDILGKIIITESIRKGEPLSIPFETAAAGIYGVRYDTDAATLFQKIEKQ